MKNGGNAACAKYLTSKGISPSTPIKQKYESPQAQLYKEVLKARIAGLPEPTTLPQPAPRSGSAHSSTSYSSSSSYPSASTNVNTAMSSSAASKKEDPNGMERLTGETEAQYVARQTRLRDEAKARMAAKFGNGGMGSGGGGRMAGIGSDPNYNPNAGTGMDDLVAGIGSAFSTLGALGGSVIHSASQMVNDPHLKENVRSTGSVLYSTGMATGSSLWSSFTKTATNFASALTEPDEEEDGLADFQRRMHEQSMKNAKSGTNTSRYSGFGSEDYYKGKGSMGATKISDQGQSNDLIDFGNQWGNESDFAFAQSKKETNISPAPTSSHSLPPVASYSAAAGLQKRGSNLSTGSLPKKVDGTGDDFFSAFGA